MSNLSGSLVGKFGLYKKYKKVKILGEYLENDTIYITAEELTQPGIIIKDKKNKFFINDNPLFHIDEINRSNNLNYVIKKLAFWQQQHYFDSNSWDGIEKMHYDISKLSTKIGIESAGWYKYDSNISSYMNGKNWRIIMLDQNPFIVIECHSVAIKDYWTIITTMYEINHNSLNQAHLSIISDPDPWIRSINLSITLTELLEVPNLYSYEKTRKGMIKRLQLVMHIRKILDQIMFSVETLYKQMFNKKSFLPDYITIGINTWRIKTGKIGLLLHPKDNVTWAELVINPLAFTKYKSNIEGISTDQYIYYILLHELIHSALGKSYNNHNHTGEFKIMAAKLGLPEKYQK